MVEVAKGNNPKRNHHVLPELYLKGFVINPAERFIWVYKKGEEYNPGSGKLTNNPFRDSISKRTIRDFYAYPGEDGTRDFETYENFLEKLEKPADRIFNRRYAEGFLEASTQIVKELNRRTARNASDFLYSPQCERWIVLLFNKTEHILHKIH